MLQPITNSKDSRLNRFVNAAADRRRLSGLNAGGALPFTYHFISIFMGYFIYQDSWRPIMLPAHAAAACAYGITMAMRSVSTDLRHAIVNYTEFGIVTAFAAAVFFTRTTPGVPFINVVSGEALMIIIITFSLIIDTSKPKLFKIRAIYSLLVGIPGVFYPVGNIMVDCWLWSLPAAVGSAYFFRSQLVELERRAASAEFDRLSAFTPPAIIDRAIETNLPVEQLFAPEIRFCVCICSDWRNYQQLTATMTPPEVVNALEVYYKFCSALLVRCFPKGNYFSDWIADELFVVAFVSDGISETDVAHCGVQFARELLLERIKVEAIVRAPKAIDVGLAAGQASVGIMGPEGGRKATALGEIPGRSRRLQMAAKLLRVHRGECDRVVIGEEVSKLVGPIAGLQTFELKGEGLRDLADKSLLYVDCELPRKTA